MIAFPDRSVFRRAGIIIVPGIRAPFPDIAVHVVQAKLIGRVSANRHGLLMIGAPMTVAICLVTIVVCLLRRNRLAEMEGCHCPGPAGIFPFGF